MYKICNFTKCAPFNNRAPIYQHPLAATHITTTTTHTEQRFAATSKLASSSSPPPPRGTASPSTEQIISDHHPTPAPARHHPLYIISGTPHTAMDVGKEFPVKAQLAGDIRRVRIPTDLAGATSSLGATFATDPASIKIYWKGEYPNLVTPPFPVLRSVLGCLAQFVGCLAQFVGCLEQFVVPVYNIASPTFSFFILRHPPSSEYSTRFCECSATGNTQF